MDHDVRKAIVVNAPGLDPEVGFEKIALYDEQKTPLSLGSNNPITDELFVGQDIEVLVPGWNPTSGDKRLRIYKQAGRVWIYGDLVSGDELDYSTPVFVIPEDYKPPDLFDANDFIVGQTNGGLPVYPQFYDDDPGFGLYYVYAEDGLGGPIPPGTYMRFTQVCWPLA